MEMKNKMTSKKKKETEKTEVDKIIKHWREINKVQRKRQKK